MRNAAILVPALWLLSTGVALGDDRPGSRAQQVVSQGVAVGFDISPAPGGELRQGRTASVRFNLKDSATGNPMVGLHPAAWMDLRKPGDGSSAKDCRQKIQAFLNPSLTARPDIDLNRYYVLAMNDDASISVIDPRFDFGGSKLLTAVQLESPGQDWVISGDGRRVYVSLPAVDRVAVVDTVSWKVTGSIETGAKPVRLALQPDQRYLWVANDEAAPGDTAGGVTVIDTHDWKMVAHIQTGAGHHEIEFTQDDRLAFVTNAGSGTVSVVDIAMLRKVKDVPVGREPASLAYSDLAKAVYVLSKGDAKITVIDAARNQVRARVGLEPGARLIRFAPGGRWLLVANGRTSTLSVIDASKDQVVQTATVGAAPDALSFTKTYVYVRSADTEHVSMIPLATLGSGEIHVTDFPGGQQAPGKVLAPASAATIVAAPEGNAVLVANPLDKTIYYYAEGMAAPMGNLKNYGRNPRAVLVVDYSIREVAPGSYAASVNLTEGGEFDVAFLLDSPSVAQCFSATVEKDPAMQKARIPIRIEPLEGSGELSADGEARLRFRVLDTVTEMPRRGLTDLRVLVALSPGIWQYREFAREREGAYEIAFTPPQQGAYFVFFDCPSLSVSSKQLPYQVLMARPNAGTRLGTIARKDAQ